MSDRPIIYCDAMIRMLLQHRKVQTRRIIKPQPEVGPDSWRWHYKPSAWAMGVNMGARGLTDELLSHSPYKVGDTLWARETWSDARNPWGRRIVYRASLSQEEEYSYEDAELPGPRWRSPIFMPRWASRLSHVVTEVRATRLQDIDDADALAEGAGYRYRPGDLTTIYPGKWRDEYMQLWWMIHGEKHPWEANEWLWALTFREVGDADTTS